MSVILLRGDARELPLPDESVDLIVTSPPYFLLRSYTDNGRPYDGQIGSEETPAKYVAALLDCTREWIRVLKPEGSMFIVLGDKYSTYTGANWGNGRSLDGHRGTAKVPHGGPVNAPAVYGIPYKSLMGLPWRYAIRCIDDLGLILRAEIIWAKPNGLPESVTDRVRRAHEQVFHFTLRPRYFSAVDEIREGYAPETAKRYAAGYNPRAIDGKRLGIGTNLGGDTYGENPLGKLPGSVWDIPSQPLTVPPSLGVDHFAAFPMELPRRIISGWSPPGVCCECGQGRRPVARTDRTFDGEIIGPGDGAIFPADMKRHSRNAGIGNWRFGAATTITGYACACPQPDAPTRPAIVLDPFGGTGTTALVAHALGRHGITVDMSADYCRLARWRTTDPGERARALQVSKPPPVIDGQESLFEVTA